MIMPGLDFNNKNPNKILMILTEDSEIMRFEKSKKEETTLEGKKLLMSNIHVNRRKRRGAFSVSIKIDRKHEHSNIFNLLI